MAFTLDQVVPWGRSFDEYVSMFGLSHDDLGKRILGCADGPAAFNSVLSKQGSVVVSVDPIYRFTPEELRSRINATYGVVMEQTRNNADEFVWDHIPSIDALGRIRTDAMNLFLADFPSGLIEGRYIDASLPSLPFSDGEFELALCSHFLFLYSGHLSEEFHMESIRELCRVSSEVRIFPLLEMGAVKSRHLDSVIQQLRSEGYRPDIRAVRYEFQKGGNEMLRIRVG
jgi:hypothetical protein